MATGRLTALGQENVPIIPRCLLPPPGSQADYSQLQDIDIHLTVQSQVGGGALLGGSKQAASSGALCGSTSSPKLTAQPVHLVNPDLSLGLSANTPCRSPDVSSRRQLEHSARKTALGDSRIPLANRFAAVASQEAQTRAGSCAYGPDSNMEASGMDMSDIPPTQAVENPETDPLELLDTCVLSNQPSVAGLSCKDPVRPHIDSAHQVEHPEPLQGGDLGDRAGRTVSAAPEPAELHAKAEDQTRQATCAAPGEIRHGPSGVPDTGAEAEHETDELDDPSAALEAKPSPGCQVAARPTVVAPEATAVNSLHPSEDSMLAAETLPESFVPLLSALTSPMPPRASPGDPAAAPSAALQSCGPQGIPQQEGEEGGTAMPPVPQPRLVELSVDEPEGERSSMGQLEAQCGPRDHSNDAGALLRSPEAPPANPGPASQRGREEKRSHICPSVGKRHGQAEGAPGVQGNTGITWTQVEQAAKETYHFEEALFNPSGDPEKVLAYVVIDTEVEVASKAWAAEQGQSVAGSQWQGSEVWEAQAEEQELDGQSRARWQGGLWLARTLQDLQPSFAERAKDSCAAQSQAVLREEEVVDERWDTELDEDMRTPAEAEAMMSQWDNTPLEGCQYSLASGQLRVLGPSHSTQLGCPLPLPTPQPVASPHPLCEPGGGKDRCAADPNSVTPSAEAEQKEEILVDTEATEWDSTAGRPQQDNGIASALPRSGSVLPRDGPIPNLAETGCEEQPPIRSARRDSLSVPVPVLLAASSNLLHKLQRQQQNLLPTKPRNGKLEEGAGGEGANASHQVEEPAQAELRAAAELGRNANGAAQEGAGGRQQEDADVEGEVEGVPCTLGLASLPVTPVSLRPPTAEGRSPAELPGRTKHGEEVSAKVTRGSQGPTPGLGGKVQIAEMEVSLRLDLDGAGLTQEALGDAQPLQLFLDSQAQDTDVGSDPQEGQDADLKSLRENLSVVLPSGAGRNSQSEVVPDSEPPSPLARPAGGDLHHQHPESNPRSLAAALGLVAATESAPTTGPATPDDAIGGAVPASPSLRRPTPPSGREISPSFSDPLASCVPATFAGAPEPSLAAGRPLMSPVRRGMLPMPPSEGEEASLRASDPPVDCTPGFDTAFCLRLPEHGARLSSAGTEQPTLAAKLSSGPRDGTEEQVFPQVKELQPPQPKVSPSTFPRPAMKGSLGTAPSRRPLTGAAVAALAAKVAAKHQHQQAAATEKGNSVSKAVAVAGGTPAAAKQAAAIRHGDEFSFPDSQASREAAAALEDLAAQPSAVNANEGWQSAGIAPLGVSGNTAVKDRDAEAVPQADSVAGTTSARREHRGAGGGEPSAASGCRAPTTRGRQALAASLATASKRVAAAALDSSSRPMVGATDGQQQQPQATRSGRKRRKPKRFDDEFRPNGRDDSDVDATGPYVAGEKGKCVLDAKQSALPVDAVAVAAPTGRGVGGHKCPQQRSGVAKPGCSKCRYSRSGCGVCRQLPRSASGAAGVAEEQHGASCGKRKSRSISSPTGSQAQACKRARRPAGERPRGAEDEDDAGGGGLVCPGSSVKQHQRQILSQAIASQEVCPLPPAKRPTQGAGRLALLFTGLSKEDKRSAETAAEKLRATVLDATPKPSNPHASSTVVVVAPRGSKRAHPPTTEKYLFGLAAGCKIVEPAWLQQAASRAGQASSSRRAEPHVVSEGRIGEPSCLAGLPICLAGEDAWKRALGKVLRHAGAVPLTSLERAEATDSPPAFVVANPSDVSKGTNPDLSAREARRLMHSGARIVDSDWLVTALRTNHIPAEESAATAAAAQGHGQGDPKANSIPQAAPRPPLAPQGHGRPKHTAGGSTAPPTPRGSPWLGAPVDPPEHLSHMRGQVRVFYGGFVPQSAACRSSKVSVGDCVEVEAAGPGEREVVRVVALWEEQTRGGTKRMMSARRFYRPKDTIFPESGLPGGFHGELFETEHAHEALRLETLVRPAEVVMAPPGRGMATGSTSGGRGGSRRYICRYFYDYKAQQLRALGA